MPLAPDDRIRKGHDMPEPKKKQVRHVSRRRFLGAAGLVAGGAAAATGSAIEVLARGTVVPVQAPPCKDVALSEGYLLVDTRKCAGCATCMLACSMVHEKKANLSLSRIQIVQTALAPFPFDLDVHQCRQCVDPRCVQQCPTGAMHVDAGNGNVRTVNAEECIGCGVCLQACPRPPHRTIWNHETGKSMKCDLCADAPYWKHTGGPHGQQACVVACPMGALKVVNTVPDQTDSWGYDVNLRQG